MSSGSMVCDMVVNWQMSSCSAATHLRSQYASPGQESILQRTRQCQPRKLNNSRRHWGNIWHWITVPACADSAGATQSPSSLSACLAAVVQQQSRQGHQSARVEKQAHLVATLAGSRSDRTCCSCLSSAAYSRCSRHRSRSAKLTVRATHTQVHASTARRAAPRSRATRCAGRASRFGTPSSTAVAAAVAASGSERRDAAPAMAAISGPKAEV